MASPARPPIIFCLFFALASVSVAVDRSSVSRFRDVCPKAGFSIDFELRSQCPRWIDLAPPLPVNGEKFEQKLATCGSSYKSVLFYAPWCPFSTKALPIFYALNSIFPQVEHLTVEESSVMPSVLSRYGIHSFPVILLANCTTAIRYHGPKDLSSLIRFYKKATGYNPITDLVPDQSTYSESKSLRELVKTEPYLTFAVIFLCLKMLMWSVPILYYRVKVLWLSHVSHMYLGLLPGSSQLLQRVLHVFDVKRIWSKFRLCNGARDFRKGANNARVWATSLASVSLGESSSSRLSHLD